MRLFIAIRLSDEMCKALVQCMHDLKKQGVEGSYVPAQNLHMTLAFIGEYKDPDKVKKVMEKVSLPQCRLSLSEKGNFGNLLWAGVKGNQKLKSYVKELREELKNNGIPFDQEKFVPHITLIRKASARKPYYPDQESLCQETLSGTAAKGRDDRGKSISYEIRDKKRESSIQRTFLI